MMPLRQAACLGLALMLAACQPLAVKPGPEDPPEPVPQLPPPVRTPEPPPPPATPPPPDPMDTGAEVFDHLAARFDAPVCVKGIHNRAWRQRYAGHPASFSRHVARILPLMAYVAREVERRGLPAEFALLPIVESWYRPAAIGPGGPAGMWQMIASTARNHGVRVLPGYDGRLNPVESTDAALDYLQALSVLFDGDWRAMAMAYNAGEYRILRAFRTNGDTRVSGEGRLPRGLSRTTYDYVAKLHALACLIAEPERQGLVLPRETRFAPLARFPVPAGAGSLDAAARSLGTDAAQLRALNPAFRQGRVVAGGGLEVIAPAAALARRVAAAPDAAAPAADAPEARTHEVRRGDTLSRIAARYGVPLRQLFRLNDLDGRSILQIGQHIQVDPPAP